MAIEPKPIYTPLFATLVTSQKVGYHRLDSSLPDHYKATSLKAVIELIAAFVVFWQSEEGIIGNRAGTRYLTKERIRMLKNQVTSVCTFNGTKSTFSSN